MSATATTARAKKGGGLSEGYHVLIGFCDAACPALLFFGFGSGYAVSDGMSDPWVKDYLTDDFFGTRANLDLIAIEPGDFKAWGGAISGEVAVASRD